MSFISLAVVLAVSAAPTTRVAWVVEDGTEK